jgi:putative transposase
LDGTRIVLPAGCSRPGYHFTTGHGSRRGATLSLDESRPDRGLSVATIRSDIVYEVIQAFPEETMPRFLVRDRDKIYGERFRRAIEVLGIEEVVTAARSPWQNPYAERLIGSLRRDCLDHVIVLDEVHPRRILGSHFEYYNGTRCHLSLAGDAPEPRGIEGPELGEVVEFPEVGGLHHRYVRAAA